MAIPVAEYEELRRKANAIIEAHPAFPALRERIRAIATRRRKRRGSDDYPYIPTTGLDVLAWYDLWRYPKGDNADARIAEAQRELAAMCGLPPAKRLFRGERIDFTAFRDAGASL